MAQLSPDHQVAVVLGVFILWCCWDAIRRVHSAPRRARVPRSPAGGTPPFGAPSTGCTGAGVPSVGPTPTCRADLVAALDQAADAFWLKVGDDSAEVDAFIAASTALESYDTGWVAVDAGDADWVLDVLTLANGPRLVTDTEEYLRLHAQEK